MKNRLVYFLFPIFCLGYILILGNSTGAPAQNTGAPDETTCGRTGCHAVMENQGSATIDLDFNNGDPTYIAGEVYPLAITLSGLQNADRNGFQIVALDSLNNNIGSWILTDETTTQIRAGNSISDRSYVTQTFNGVSQSSWMFNWQAPMEMAGEVIFYLAVNDADGNGGRTGDDIYITNLSVEEGNTTSTVEQEYIASQVNIFPNPTKGFLNIDYGGVQVSRIDLFHANGQLVHQSNNQTSIDLSSLPSGVYYMSLITNEGIGMKKLLLEN